MAAGMQFQHFCTLDREAGIGNIDAVDLSLPQLDPRNVGADSSVGLAKFRASWLGSLLNVFLV
jgi:hypothetical protein